MFGKSFSKVLEHIDTLVGDILSPQQLAKELDCPCRPQYSHCCSSVWLEMWTMHQVALVVLGRRITADNHGIAWHNIFREACTGVQVPI